MVLDYNLIELITVSGGTLRPGATELQLEAVEISLYRRRGIVLPQEAKQFYAKTNGFQISALKVHAVEELIEYSVSLASDSRYFPGFLILSECEQIVRGWDPRKSAWFLGADGDVFGHYSSINEALADALWEVQVDSRPFMPRSFTFFMRDEAGQAVTGLLGEGD